MVYTLIVTTVYQQLWLAIVYYNGDCWFDAPIEVAWRTHPKSEEGHGLAFRRGGYSFVF